MSKIDDFFENCLAMTIGNDEEASEAHKKNRAIVSNATDEELQEIADKSHGQQSIENLKIARGHFRETLN